MTQPMSLSLTTQVDSLEIRQDSTWISVNPSEWVALHEEIYATHPRLEWLTATHLGSDSFCVASCVTRDDMSNHVVIESTVSNGRIDTLSNIFATACLHESEMTTLCGIIFVGRDAAELFAISSHGIPLRKDFALQARITQPWPGAVEPDPESRRRPSLPPGVFQEWTQ